MAANFTISSDSESDPSEEVEEGESSTEQEQQLRPRHALTLPELRMAGKTTDMIIWRWHSVERQPQHLWMEKKRNKAHHCTVQPLILSREKSEITARHYKRSVISRFSISTHQNILLLCKIPHNTAIKTLTHDILALSPSFCSGV